MAERPNRRAALRVWEARYRHADERGAELSPDDTWRRVARAIAAAEGRAAAEWEARFLEILTAGEFLPGGRIVAGAGAGLQNTLLNCFVMGPVVPTYAGIYDALKEGAATLQSGGGVGYDLSPLGRSPADPLTPARVLPLWNDTAELTGTKGGRRGAMMVSLACDHSGVHDFARAKIDRSLPRLTLAVQVTDDFAGSLGSNAGRSRARDTWAVIAAASHACGDPGVLFIDRINRENNLYYCERLTTTNPCGEAPLPAYGGCDLGSINLVALVRDAFTPRARLDEDRLAYVAAVAVRLLDDVLEVTSYPQPEQRSAALASRRVGLGLTGLGDALIMLGLRYGDPAAVRAVVRIGECVRDAAYEASVTLAASKGAFPQYARDAYVRAPFVARLPATLRERIKRGGIRNSHLLAIAPAGSISLLAGNVSSGIEPPLAPSYRMRVTLGGAEPESLPLENVACSLWRDQGRAGLPPAFLPSVEIPPEAHLAIQSALQVCVDGAISKTIALPATAEEALVERVFRQAAESNVKGLTVYRAGIAGAPLSCRNECG